MAEKSEYMEIMTNRGNMYNFLGRLFETEVDKELLEKMAGESFQGEEDTEELASGAGMLKSYVNSPRLDPLTELAADYAKVFLAAGIHSGGAAFPYESVYTSPERLVMQDARDEVLAIYRNKGLDVDEAMKVPEDHIAIELKFMAHLCEESRSAAEAGDWTAAAASLKEQTDFLEKHLLNWAPAFCADIEKYSKTDFYRAVSKITVAFLRLDLDNLADLSNT